MSGDGENGKQSAAGSAVGEAKPFEPLSEHRTQFSPEDNDALLQEASRQLSSGVFDHSNQAAIERLVDGLGDTRGLVRFGFAERLAAVGRPALPLLRHALRADANVAVRRAAAKIFTLINDAGSANVLLEAMIHDPDPVVQGSATGALAEIGAPAVPLLLGVLERSAEPALTKGLAAWALASIGARGAALLKPAMESERVDVRAAVVGALGDQIQNAADREALKLLHQALEDPAEDVQAEAVTAFGKLNSSEFVPLLAANLKAGRPDEVRRNAALALMKCRNEAGLSPLLAALQEEGDGPLNVVLNLAITQLKRSLQTLQD